MSQSRWSGYPWRLFLTIARGTALARGGSLRNRTVFAIAFAGYGLLAIAATAPLAWHATTHVPHDLGDPLLSATLLWWNTHTLPLSVRWWDGFFFAPAMGSMAFSDHRLGESLIAAPLIWAGAGPIAAYNFTLLATFPLCAIAAHALAYVLTRRHDAALLAGLSYGFNPYRFAHIEHLELLAAFGMPAALAALHLYLVERRRIWIVLFAAALLLQALLCSYYFLFFLVMVALWAAWFPRRGDGRVLAGVVASIAVVVVCLSPIAWWYRAIHHHYGFVRGYNDIIALSADLTSFVTASPLVGLWGWTASLNGPERQLFPGAAVALLAVIGGIAAWRSSRAPAEANRASIAFVAIACTCALIAAAAGYLGPWRASLGGLALSVTVPFKPLSLAVASGAAALGLSLPVRRAYQQRSSLAFYLAAAVCLFICSLGPKPAAFGRQFLYEPPYAWLMRASVFGESIRVPARFAMVGILALSVAAALSFARLSHYRTHVPLLAALAIVIAVEGWSPRLPLFEPPRAWPASVSTAGIASFVELPLGETNRDVAAMYRSIVSGIPTVNGYSGYAPTHYSALQAGLEERDETMLDALASRGPLLVVVDRRAPDDAARMAWLSSFSRARLTASDDDRAWFVVDGQAPQSTTCGSPLPVTAVNAPRDLGSQSVLTDGNSRTFWVTPGAQRAGDSLVVDLGRVKHLCSVQLEMGHYVAMYPRLLSVATSVDGETWQTTFSGKTGGRAILASIAQPLAARLEFPLGESAARFVRLRIEDDHPTIPWLVRDLTVSASRQE